MLDGKPIPASLPWLNANPLIYASNRSGVISSAVFWIGALLVLYTALYLWPRRAGRASPIRSNPVRDR